MWKRYKNIKRAKLFLQSLLTIKRASDLTLAPQGTEIVWNPSSVPSWSLFWRPAIEWGYPHAHGSRRSSCSSVLSRYFVLRVPSLLFFFLPWLFGPEIPRRVTESVFVPSAAQINSVKTELECTGHKGIAEESIKKDRVRQETTKPTTTLILVFVAATL